MIGLKHLSHSVSVETLKKLKPKFPEFAQPDPLVAKFGVLCEILIYILRC